MTMTANARLAFDELKDLGAPVMDWGEEDGYGPHIAFVLIWAEDGWQEEPEKLIFANMNGEYIRETWVDGKYQNPGGFRQDVHEILKKYSLVTDWDNPGQVVVYNDPDAPGFRHARY